MSDHNPPRQTLAVAREVRAILPTQTALDEAMDALRLRGFDRADLSLPQAAGAASTTQAGASNTTTEIDRQQARTLGGSTAGVVAALGGAVITVATGGAAAVAVGVAAAAGLAAGGATHAALAGGGEDIKTNRDSAADKGELVLAVAIRDPEREQAAHEVLAQAGATHIATVEHEPSSAT